MASLTDLPFSERAANAVVSYVAYLWKTLWPSGLAVIYPLEAWSAGAVLASTAVLLAVTAAAVRWAGAYPYVLVGWLWYLVALVPVIGIIKVGNAAMADRYTYVSLIGPFVALSWGVSDLAMRWSRGREALAASGLLAAGALACLTFLQAGHWKDSDTLFRHAIAVTEDNYTAHTNLAVELIGKGRLDEAMTHLEKAERLKPDFSPALYNIGVIRMKQGDSEAARRYFLSAIRHSPGFARAYRSLAFLQLERGEAADAVRNFEKALALGDPDPLSYSGLADALAVSSRYEEAFSSYGRALALKPDAAEVHYNAAGVLIAMGRLDEAIGHLREAVRLKPDYARAYNNLGSALMLAGREDEAIEHFREATRIDPDYRIARENLNDALSRRKAPMGK